MIAGAHYADPTCEVLVDYANGWAEVNGCYELATSMNQQGASLIYHTTSAGGLGILNARQGSQLPDHLLRRQPERRRPRDQPRQRHP